MHRESIFIRPEKIDIWREIRWYFSIFIIFSCAGWIYEQIVAVISGRHMEFELFWKMYFGVNLPFLQIYGIGAVIVFLASRIMDRMETKNLVSRCIAQGIILSIFEFLSGVFCLAVFHVRFWDYSDKFMNIGGHVCLLSVFAWFMFSMIFEMIRKFVYKKAEQRAIINLL